MSIAVVLTGCFTGIESTPKITSNEVKRNVPSQRPEETYLTDVKPQNITQWTEGKTFCVTDSRIGLALNVTPGDARLMPGDTLRFSSVTEATSIMGLPVAQISFDGPRGIKATYRSDASLEALRRLDGGVTIPFTVELSVVDDTRSRMLGNDYWVTTAEWLDRRNHSRRGRKFIRAKVIDVGHGDDIYPVCLTLADYNRQPADTFALLMTPGTNLPSASRRFDTLFSLTDPKRSYPQISDANWQLIREGRVAEGMTRLEVRLALGEPADVQRHAGYSAVGEIWKYNNGTFLIFEDGILKQSR